MLGMLHRQAREQGDFDALIVASCAGPNLAEVV